jgi:hypothetical protein
MIVRNYLNREAKAWVRHNSSASRIIQVVPVAVKGNGQCYELYTDIPYCPDYLGRILFDEEGYWIYDGNELSVVEQEQLGQFIINQALRELQEK